MPSPYSCYLKEGLSYVAIAEPAGFQPSSYTKCTRANIRSRCNIRSISNAKYLRPIILSSLYIPLLIAIRVLGLICRYKA